MKVELRFEPELSVTNRGGVSSRSVGTTITTSSSRGDSPLRLDDVLEIKSIFYLSITRFIDFELQSKFTIGIDYLVAYFCHFKKHILGEVVMLKL